VTRLGALQPMELVAAVAELRDDEVVSVLQRLPQTVVNGKGRAFVEAFGEAEWARLLAQLPDRAIGEWLARLRGSLTNSSVNQLTKIMRQAAR